MSTRRQPRQIALPLAYRAAAGRADFLVAPCNAAALAALDDWAGWPGGCIALSGPARAGKSHLAAVWAAEAGATTVAARDLATDRVAALASTPLAVEDVPDLAGRAEAEAALFHLMNLMRAEGRALLLTGRDAPATWRVGLPDLASRLSALSVARIAAPDDAVLSAVLVKLAADRGMRLAPATVAYCTRRMERSFTAAEALIGALDRASLAARRPVTRALAAEILGAGADPTQGPV